MKLDTTRFGEIEVEEDKIVRFPQGIPGFEHCRDFIFLQPPNAQIPVWFMQSIEDGALAFMVMNPFLVFPDYTIDLPDSVQEELDIRTEEDVMTVAIITISERKEMTLNLLAPVILNQRTRTAKQVVLHNSGYQTKHAVNLQEIAATGGRRGDL
ncbi:flagellar assembly protein FliW [Paenibacillus sp.]|uniref:flagellar assembly protein FliW n=1 Tax=Paenibacillus sp. TaxID=58172 RepID=UPI002D4DB614|nr:flagellar assembly protein FliW [Paenibacillus sp.]HZG87390.1 flagellar assembly protein FliW [Paenibacillus sp.]